MSGVINQAETIALNNEAADMYLNFTVGKEVYGIGVRNVVQIVAMREINEMPEMPPNMKGFINLRGSVIPVYSLYAIFGKAEPEYAERACIMVINVDDQQMGLIADSIKEAATIEPGRISPPPKMGTAGVRDYVKGIARSADGQTIVLLNVSSLFTKAA